MSRKSFEELGKSQRYNRLSQLREYMNINNNPENQQIDLNQHVLIDNILHENLLNDNIIQGPQETLNEIFDHQNLLADRMFINEPIHDENIDLSEGNNADVNEIHVNIDILNDHNPNGPIEEREIREEESEEEAFDVDDPEEEDIDETIRNNHENLDDDQPLYEGAPLTVTESMLMLLTLLVRHNVSMLCLEDIIKVINLHCITQGLKKNILFKFKTFFSINDTNVKKHFYCTTCYRELERKQDVCPLCPRQENSFFCEMSIEDQLGEMFQRSRFYNKLQKRFERPINENISDIYDGSIYKTWIDHGFLQNPHNISFSWYTDGVPVFKSSQISMWPIYLSINELAFIERKKKENTLLLGLWCGKKPSANLFLYKLRPQFDKIATGISIFLPEAINSIKVRGILLMGTADLVAKNDFMNFIQFNGYYGCTICDIEGMSLPLDPRGSILIYPFQQNINLRTLENCINWANQASVDNPVMGIKGPSALSLVMPDYIQGMAIDRMHGVDGGVIKKLLSLIFDSTLNGQPYSLYAEIDIINNRLTALKPPKFVHHMLRSIVELVHWKASELKMWCFFYSLPVFNGIFRQDYFAHYLLLITAVSLLSAENITPYMLNAAENLLCRFVIEFEILYGRRYCSIVIHILLHLVECVRRLGPLWAHSCFEYENINGQLLKLVHGTRHIETQVANSHYRCIKMVKLIDQLPEGQIRHFCKSKKKQVMINEKIDDVSYSVGTYKYIPSEELSEDLGNLLYNSAILGNISIHKYYRFLKNKHLYISEMYGKNFQTNSSVVQYLDNNNQLQFGLLSYFIKITYLNCTHHLQTDCTCNGDHYAIIKKFTSEFAFVARGYHYTIDSSSFLHKCNLDNDNILLIPVVNIQQLCVIMQVDDVKYIGIPVNHYELE